MRLSCLACAAFIVLAWSHSASYAGDIRVAVSDQTGQRVDRAEVHLANAQGTVASALTDSWGAVTFAGLPAGPYQLSLQHQPGQIVTEPACGVFFIELQPHQTKQLSFKIDIMGVSVDFGRPAGGGADDTPPTTQAASANAGEPFQFAMRMEHLDTVTQTPEQLILTGQFHLPEPGMHVVIDSVVSSRLYDFSETNVLFSQTPDGTLQVFFEVPHEPHLSLNGDTLIFYGHLYANQPHWLENKKHELCFCVQSLVFYHQGQPSQDPDLAKFAQGWGQCFRPKLPLLP